MAARGAYAKGVAKREEILTTALEVIAKNGYHKTSIRDLAAAVGLSQTGLLHYFGTKEELFVAILQKRDATDEQNFAVDPADYAPAQLIEGLVSVGRHNATVPGLVQLYAQFSTEAAEEGHPAREYFQQRYADYRRLVATAIRALQQTGEVPASVDPERTAALMAAATDGLQTQWMLDSSIDMGEHLEYLWKRLMTGGDA
jgi:AcrR family transcriptional regulator